MFMVQMMQSDAGFTLPEPEMSSKALMTLFVCAFMFAILAVARNRILDER